jgi:membrane associated rhomboid family serine protease
MIPIGDYAGGARPRFPLVNLTLIVINIAVFVYQLSLGDRLNTFFLTWGVIPQELTTGTDRAPLLPSGLPVYVTLLSSIFMHGGWLHLIGNMLFLWVFGDNVENAFGSVKYLLFYVVCGVAASWAQIITDTSSQIPMIGASGAVAGVMGAYLIMFPGAMVRTIVSIVFFVTVVHLPAIILIGLWFLLQLFQGISSVGMDAGTAFWAHVGGLIVGAALTPLLRSRSYKRASPTVIRGY